MWFLKPNLTKMFENKDIYGLIKLLKNNKLKNDVTDYIIKIGNEAVEPMIQLLSSENYELRKIATYILGNIGDQNITEHLIKLLKDQNVDVRLEAIDMLGKIGGDTAEYGIIEALSDIVPNVRRKAVWKLREIGNNMAINALINAFKNEEKLIDDDSFMKKGITPFDVKKEIIEALGETDEKNVVEMFEQALRKRINGPGFYCEVCKVLLIRTLEKMGDTNSGDTIALALNDDSINVKKQALLTIRNMGVPVYKQLINSMDDHYIGEEATELLIEIGESAIEHLVASCKSEDDRTKQKVMYILSRINWDPKNDEEKILKYLYVLNDYDKVIELGSDALEQLFYILKNNRSKDNDIKIITTISKIDDERSIDSLIYVLRFIDKEIQDIAIKALNRLDWKPKCEFEKALYFLANDEIDKLKELGISVRQIFIDSLKDQDQRIRKGAAIALGKMQNFESIPFIVELLGDRDRDVRGTAKYSLETLIGEPATDALIGALNNENADIRILAIDILGNFNNSKAREALFGVLKGNNVEMKMRVLDGFRHTYDPQSISAVILALKDEHHDVRFAASDVLSTINVKSAIDHLIQTLKDPMPQVRSGAASALGKIGDKKVRDVLTEYYAIEHHPFVKTSIKEAINELRFR